MRWIILVTVIFLMACSGGTGTVAVDQDSQDAAVVDTLGGDARVLPDGQGEDLPPLEDLGPLEDLEPLEDTEPQEDLEPLEDTLTELTPQCGNGTCDLGEDQYSCPEDCQGPDCGDGTCGEDEDPCTCPGDCLKQATDCCEAEDCPQPNCGECCVATCNDFVCGDTVLADCCGNGTCEEGENAAECPEDCTCGDGICDSSESTQLCTVDCPPSPVDPDCVNNLAICGLVTGTAVVEIYNDGLNDLPKVPYPGVLIRAFEDDQLIASALTGDDGTYTLTLVPGNYLLRADPPAPENPWEVIDPQMFQEEITLTLEGLLKDFLFNYYGDTVDKPNIYLYPETTTQVSVNLVFSPGNFLVISEPLYNSGWTVTAAPDGQLDGQWGYLFYEAAVSGDYQKQLGHNVPKQDLEAWMNTALPAYGLNAQETKDFTDFWKQALPEADWYAFYPQYQEQIDPIISLQITPTPDSLLRLWFVVIPTNQPQPLQEPQPQPFPRTGFTAVEWGVIVQ